MKIAFDLIGQKVQNLMQDSDDSAIKESAQQCNDIIVVIDYVLKFINKGKEKFDQLS